LTVEEDAMRELDLYRQWPITADENRRPVAAGGD